eukprot:TRINITY_DN48034_c0_g1_i1.p1 TRINITY_DN48034_c0_g1~~TRINITY_DN48034_c0_g1_i1.p1  ORF type:complete len:115 (+),score=14.63 TRINITY_DN48034_c0_g1_i1:131-475(+)
MDPTAANTGDKIVLKTFPPHGSKADTKKVLLHFLCKLRYLGLIGYGLEWLLEASHVSKRLHHWLHRLVNPKMHLLAISCVLVGHVAEHLHQEEENHHQEAHIRALEKRLNSKTH